MIKTTYKTVLPCEVEDYVKRKKNVHMLDKEEGEVCGVGTWDLDDKYMINCLNDKADRYYFWVIEKDEIDKER